MRAGLCFALVACGPSATATPCATAIRPGELVISEVFASAAGGDLGAEWFEIYNASDHALALDGLAVVHARPDGSQAHVHHVAHLALAAGQYATLGNGAPDQLPPYVDYGYGSDLGAFFNSGGGRLALACGDTTIDAIGYGDVLAGHSRELAAGAPPDAAGNDDPARWCDANATEFVAGNFGTPGQESDCTPLAMGQCSDGGVARDVVVPQPGQLVITELMPSPTQVPDSSGEWFEATALADVDLNGVALDRGADSQLPDVIGATSCVRVPAGGYAVFARDSDATRNGGLPAIAATFSFALVAGAPSAPGQLRLLAGATVIDAVQWTSSRSGAALQLDPAASDAQSNDDPANFCSATVRYGLGDLGTPGAPNLPCATAPPPGTCNAGAVNRAIVPPPPGALRITEIMANPKVEPAEEWFEVQNTSGAAFDLNELALDRAGDTRAPDVIHAADCKPVAPGAFALFARSTDPATNGGLPPVDATFGFALVNSGGDVRVLAGDTVLDATTWTSSHDGVSMQLAPQVCPGATPYGDGSNLGTPKAANSCL